MLLNRLLNKLINKAKKRLNVKNRPLKPSERAQIPLYLESYRFWPTSEYKLVLGLTYPFECYEFETVSERDAALVDELDYLTRFMSRMASREGSGFNPRTQGEHLDQERHENGLDPHDASIHLVECAKLAQFDSIKKYGLSLDELCDVIRHHGAKHHLRLTKSGLYVIHESAHGHDETSCSSETGNSSQHEHEENEHEQSDQFTIVFHFPHPPPP